MNQALFHQPKRFLISCHRRCFKASFSSSVIDDVECIVTSFPQDAVIPTKPRSDDILVQDFADSLERPSYISPQATLQDAMDKIVSMQVSCLLVCSYKQAEITGILTVRDILSKFGRGKKLNMTLDELLQSDVSDIITPSSRMIYCTPSDTLRQVRLAMRSYRVRHLPVVFNKPSPTDENVITPALSGIVTAKAMADYASLLKDGVGGKGVFLDFLEKRRGLPKGTVLNRDRYDPNQDVGLGEDDEELDDLDQDNMNSDVMDGVRGWNESKSGVITTKRRKLLDTTFGACLLPHPFKSPTGVAQTRRDYGADELCKDITLSEDAFFALRLRWPSPGRPNNHATFAGVADGVGSWRAYGVDPRNFSHKLMKYAAETIQELGAVDVDMDSNFVAPPSPLEVLGHAWSKVIAEETIGSATACIVSLDQRLNQLTYANLGDSGVIVLRHVIPQLRGSATVSTSSTDLALAATFMSQQQLHAFNRPYQLGYDDPKHYPEDKGPPAFEHPIDSNVTGYGVKPGDIVIVATDGLFDNMELDEVCAITAKWEEEWFKGANEGAPSPQFGPEPVNEMEDLSQRLCARARELSLDSSTDSPFAVLAKDNGIMWSGGMPDDTTIVALRVVKSVNESLTFAK